MFLVLPVQLAINWFHFFRPKLPSQILEMQEILSETRQSHEGFNYQSANTNCANNTSLNKQMQTSQAAC